MASVDFIITALHYAEREGCGSVRERILKRRESLHKRQNIALTITGLDAPGGVAVRARIWQGQWIGDCECGGAEFVAPTEPIFYCFSCGNRENKNRVRPVQFPADYVEIETAVLARPVHDLKGLTELERAGLAQPAVVVLADGAEFPLVRAWNYDESLDELVTQNQVLEGLKVERGKVAVIEVLSKREPFVEVPKQIGDVYVGESYMPPQIPSSDAEAHLVLPVDGGK